MDSMIVVRLIAVVFLAVVVIAAVIEVRRADDQYTPAPAPRLAPAHDPLREEQRRCQQRGQAAASDPDCLRVWAETRDRFLGRAPSPRPIEGH